MNEESSPDDLQADISRLQAQVRDNERIWSGFRNIELSIIGARSPHELARLLVDGICTTFRGVECATLAYSDSDHSLTGLLTPQNQPDTEQSFFVAISQPSLKGLFPNFPRPHLGRCDAAMQSLLFASCPHRLGSMALVPLILRGRLIGSLNQASRYTNHYDENAATDFLEHLAAISAMCIDNAINRERLKQDGLTDALTGVANRRFFERRLHEELRRWHRRGGSLVCMFVDIDHFKQINDEHGHQAGDQVLNWVADLLGKDLRGSDVLARYGGEEFVLLLPETSEAQGKAIAERLRKKVAHTQFDSGSGKTLTVTLSAGLTVLDRRSRPPVGGAADWLLGQADSALYRAKQTGRNKVVIV